MPGYTALPFALMPRPRPEKLPQLLLSVGPLLGQEVDLDAVLARIVEQVTAAMSADRGTLFLLDGTRNELFSRAGHLPEIRQIRLKVGQGVAGAVAKAGKAINVPNPGGEARFFPDVDKQTGYRTRSLLAVPLTGRQGEVFGVVQVLNRKHDVFSAADQQRLEQMAVEISSALQVTSLYEEICRARSQQALPLGYFFNNIVGDSPGMRRLYLRVQKAASTDATVLIRGESGTGKELFARAIHVNSPRAQQPFVKVDCAALPPTLIENELFGHEKGAFTGASAKSLGKFEAAAGGTLFLDEIGELPLSVQSKLLRLVQDREFERVGGTRTIKADVRIVAATHRDLRQMVTEGIFREDLYYRIRVVEMVLPPLRERGAEDIERLARHFLAAAAKRYRVDEAPELSAGALERLRRYRWPGNVRELEHCLESAVVLAEGQILAEQLSLPSSDSASTGEDGLTLADAERRHIEKVLRLQGGNRTLAAKALGIGRNTLARKIREHGLA